MVSRAIPAKNWVDRKTCTLYNPANLLGENLESMLLPTANAPTRSRIWTTLRSVSPVS